MLRLSWLTGLLLLLPAASMADPLDYAYQARLSDVDTALQRVPLELEVILNLTRTDLGDIAVFNADGKPLLHSIVRAQVSTTKQTRELAFHEFSRFQRQQSKTVTTREQTQQQDSLTELVTTETVATQTRRKDYLVELPRDLDKPAILQRIELQWTHAPAEQILEIRVEAGDALDDLRVIQSSKSLTNLDSSDPGWRSIEGISSSYRYLRLTAINDVTRFDLQHVVAHYEQAESAATLSHRVTTAAVNEGDEIFYRINYPSTVHAQSLRIVPATPNSVISGRLLASWGDSEELRPIRGKLQQHNIEGGDVRASKPIILPKRRYREIVLSSATELTIAPAIELIYPQYELLFLGDGNGPYSIAWGNHESSGPVSDLATFLDESLQQAQRRAKTTRPGTTEESGGQARLLPQTELPWKKWVLWTLLLLAVMVTVRMAFKLYREMNAPSST